MSSSPDEVPVVAGAAPEVEFYRRILGRQGIDPDLLDIWATSAERNMYMSHRSSVRFRVVASAGLALAGATLVIVSQTFSANDLAYDFRNPDLPVFAGVGYGVLVLALLEAVWALAPYVSARRAFVARVRAMASYRVDQALKALTEVMAAAAAAETAKSKNAPGVEAMDAPVRSAERVMASLWDLNRRQLDEYQVTTRRQQRMAFALTWAASVAALVVLLGGAILSLRVDSSDKAVTGGLTAVGAALSAYLGKTFFEGHRDSLEQLNFYYQEPSYTGRILAAERLARGLPTTERNEKIGKLVDGMLDWEPQPVPGKPSSRRAGAGLQKRPDSRRRPATADDLTNAAASLGAKGNGKRSS